MIVQAYEKGLKQPFLYRIEQNTVFPASIVKEDTRSLDVLNKLKCLLL